MNTYKIVYALISAIRTSQSKAAASSSAASSSSSNNNKRPIRITSMAGKKILQVIWPQVKKVPGFVKPPPNVLPNDYHAIIYLWELSLFSTSKEHDNDWFDDLDLVWSKNFTEALQARAEQRLKAAKEAKEVTIDPISDQDEHEMIIIQEEVQTSTSNKEN